MTTPAQEPADELVLEPTAPPKPQTVCDKCSTVLESEREIYWHQRRDSAGCVRSLMGMIINQEARIRVLETLLEKATAKAVDLEAIEEAARKAGDQVLADDASYGSGE